MKVPRPFPVAARDLLRTTVLDAVGEQLRRRPWPDVSMAAVASGAGVSRQTLYNEFGSRHELAQAFVLREADRFVDAVEAAVREHLDDPGAALEAAFELFLAAAADHPLVRTVVSGEGGDELLALVTTQAEPVLERATGRLATIMRDGWPQVGEPEAALLAEAVVRLAISYATLPSGPSGMTGAAVARLLAPYVERVLAGGDDGA